MKAFLLLSTVLLAAAPIRAGESEAPGAGDRVLNRVMGGDDVRTKEKSDPDKKTVERPDAWITGKVKTSLMFHRSVSGLKTEVDTANGVVTLSGEAENQAQRDLATEYALEIEGVKKVNNTMTVRGERTIENRIDDATITTKVKSALLSRRSTSAINTSVKTNGGIVILTGTAKNEAEKELAERLARGVEGVREVRNQMTVGDRR
ncbi:MAG: BON domain-containing protein [Elusimicrobiota bacterium]|nr:BON domain-containing protein [Elusimicrobiota bacterium]